jgi:hypothetical protein
MNQVLSRRACSLPMIVALQLLCLACASTDDRRLTYSVAPGTDASFERVLRITDFAAGSADVPASGVHAIEQSCLNWHQQVRAGLRPQFFIVGSTDRSEMKPALNARFGGNSGLARARAEAVKTLIESCLEDGVGEESSRRADFLLSISGAMSTPAALRPVGYAVDRGVDVSAHWHDPSTSSSLVLDLGPSGAGPSLTDWLSLLVAITTAGVALFSWRTAKKSEQTANSVYAWQKAANRAVTFRELRTRFSDIRRNVPRRSAGAITAGNLTSALNRKDFEGIIEYWRHTFDEWFMSKKLNGGELGELWDQYYAEVVGQAAESDVMLTGLLAAFSMNCAERDKEFVNEILSRRKKDTRGVDEMIGCLNALKAEARWVIPQIFDVAAAKKQAATVVQT